LSVLGDRGGNRVGQLPREPVDDVVHLFPSAPPSRVPGRFPIRTAYTGAVTRDAAPLLKCIGKSCK
jgi:hypothetical protein